MVRACMYFETEANRASLGRNGAIVVGVGIVIGICPMCLQGAGNRQAGFLFRCPMLPQQRCCLRAVLAVGPPQGGGTLCVAGRAVSGLRMSVSRSSPLTLAGVLAYIHNYMHV